MGIAPSSRTEGMCCSRRMTEKTWYPFLTRLAAMNLASLPEPPKMRTEGIFGFSLSFGLGVEGVERRDIMLAIIKLDLLIQLI